MTIIGIRPYTLTTKDTGEVIDGVTLFCTYESDKVQGLAIDKISMSNKKLLELGYTPKLNDTIKVSYNRFGRVEAVEVA